jgi:6-phosphofructokinase
MSGLACGATTVYTPEEGISLDMLQTDIKHLVRRFKEENGSNKWNEGRVILRSESSSTTYTTEVISSVLRTEGKGHFDSRTSVLGHLQQGGIPSPLDRIRATRLAVDCIDWIQKVAQQPLVPYPSAEDDLEPTACVIGVRGAHVVVSPVEGLLKEVDIKKRTGKKEWWMGLPEMVKILSKYYFEE